MIVYVEQKRYDELIRKEALLENIKRLHGGATEFVFRDAVGHLLKTDAVKKHERD
jgi:hypothetical protein